MLNSRLENLDVKKRHTFKKEEKSLNPKDLKSLIIFNLFILCANP
jgi:hypothetical protein